MTKPKSDRTQPVAPGPITDPTTLVGELADDVWKHAMNRLGDPALAAAAAELAWRRFARNAYFEGISNPHEWLNDAVDGEAVRLARSVGATATSGARDYPPDVVSAAGRALAEAQPTGAFARIIYDSFAPTARGAFLPLRSSGDVRMLSFAAGESVIDLSVESEGGVANVMGVVVPQPEEVHVELMRRGDRIDPAVEPGGRFRAVSIEPGPLSVAIRGPQRSMITDWVSV